MATCDNCGKPRQDIDEILCRTCRPILQIRVDIEEAKAEINAAYWAFTRQAKAKPPSLVVSKAYAVLAKYKGTKV